LTDVTGAYLTDATGADLTGAKQLSPSYKAIPRDQIGYHIFDMEVYEKECSYDDIW
jgi:hypothetical protein